MFFISKFVLLVRTNGNDCYLIVSTVMCFIKFGLGNLYVYILVVSRTP